MSNVDINHFSIRLKIIRERKKLTQQDVAQALNYSQQTISKWESGTIPDDEIIQQLADFLNVRYSDLNLSPYVFEESVDYGDSYDLFYQFFASDMFQKFYSFDLITQKHLAQILFSICEMHQSQQLEISNDQDTIFHG